MISRVSVSLIMCTGGAYRPFLHDRHFSAASSFQTARAGVHIPLPRSGHDLRVFQMQHRPLNPAPEGRDGRRKLVEDFGRANGSAATSVSANAAMIWVS